MPKPDDFDIIDERNPTPAGGNSGGGAGRRGTVWLVGILVLVLFGFATGIAFMRISARLGDPTPTRAAMQPATATSPALTNPVTATVTVTPTTTGTPPVTPSPTPSRTPTPTCTIAVSETFAPLNPGRELGCATGAASIVWAAYEPFERGAMLWRSDTDDVYAVFDDGGWELVNEQWSGQEPAGRGTPPPGLVAPARGFGYVWSTRDDLFARLGWARDAEKGFCAEIQEFTGGTAIASRDVPSCTPDNLFNFAATAGWTPLLLLLRQEDATGASGGNRPAPALPPGNATTRPMENGLVYARRPAQPLMLDGNLDDWPDAWLPIANVVQVQDPGAFIGGDDLTARFQTAWSDQGLVVAVRVQDDIFSPGPDGTDLWQGDGLEFQFDARLVDDYTNTRADDDDTQLGLAPAAVGDALRTYRWLPFAREGVPAVGGMTRALGDGSDWRGYNIEALIPWPELGLSRDDATVGTAFGFNISVNDNDGPTPAQQTVLSLSPARTTHDDPTEWATLILAD